MEIGNKERNSLQRKRLAGISASLLLCRCYRRVAPAAACDRLVTRVGTSIPDCVQGGGTPLLVSTSTPRGPLWLLPEETCSILSYLSVLVSQGH